MPTTPIWTWMIYMATHNNVADAGEASLQRIRKAQLTEDVRVLVQQSAPSRTVRRVIGSHPEVVADLGSVDSGDPSTLIDFVHWGKENTQARRYALVLWSHGTGWEPREMVRLAKNQPVKIPVKEAEFEKRGPGDDARQIFFSTTMQKILNRPTPAERAVAFDDGSGNALDTIELGWAASNISRILGQPLDLFGMNACLMSTVEVTYQVRKHVQVYVASEELMPVDSWPFDKILSNLSNQPEMDAEALAPEIVAQYCSYFRASTHAWGNYGLPEGVTLSAVRPNQIDNLIGAMSNLAAFLRDDIEGQLPAIWDAHRKTRQFQFQLFDLARFCQTLRSHQNASQNSQLAAQAVLENLGNPSFMLANDYTSPAYAGVGGLTTYLIPPTPNTSISPYYQETAYARDTGWGEFLNAYHLAVLDR